MAGDVDVLADLLADQVVVVGPDGERVAGELDAASARRLAVTALDYLLFPGVLERVRRAGERAG